MPVYSVTGKLGTGKSKFCVFQAQQALREGRRVASNIELDLTHLLPSKRATYTRVPDKPTAADLSSLGHGNPESYDEDRNGVLILDELGTWLNARSFNDKDRAPVIDWLIHARKHGWDVFLICQDETMIDKQVREALVEYSCRCMRLDKVKVPFVGNWLQAIFGKRAGYLPRMHFVAARVGSGANAIVAERWAFRGNDLHAAYDTRQVFRPDYPHGAHSVLPPWDWQPPPTLRERLRVRWAAVWPQAKPCPPRPAPRPKPRIVTLIESLPLDERERWWLRAHRAGLLDAKAA